jgi:hypothetical protein
VQQTGGGNLPWYVAGSSGVPPPDSYIPEILLPCPEVRAAGGLRTVGPGDLFKISIHFNYLHLALV